MEQSSKMSQVIYPTVSCMMVSSLKGHFSCWKPLWSHYVKIRHTYIATKPVTKTSLQ